jgi:hypothetical protein
MKVLIIGDSQAAGAPGRAFESELRARGIETRRIGHSGHGAYDWTRMHWPEYQAAIRSFAPDQVIMIFGSNDPAGERLQNALLRFKASAPKVSYAGPPRYDGRPDVQAKGAPIRDMASRVFGRDYLDAYPYTGPTVPRARDRVHFGPTGGATWAAGMAREWLRGGSGVVGVRRGRIPTWAGPVILGGAAAVGLALFLRRRR